VCDKIISKKGVVVISQKIDSILQNRKKEQKKVVSQNQNLISLRNRLSDLDKIEASFKLKEGIKSLDKIIESSSKLTKRYKRDTLNIVVVGQARQGKSALLQTITGLTNKHIPTSDGADCTATKSIIKNSNSQQAKIYFYTESEFINNIINPYYESLGLSKIASISDLEFDNRLDDINIRELKGSQREHLRHIKKYKENLNKYKNLLSSEEQTISLDEIRKYVAQDDEDGNRDVHFEYMAVKEVEVEVGFNKPEVGKISVIDLPGMGDTIIGIEDKIKQEIKDNVDIVFFIKKPSHQGEHIVSDADVYLFDMMDSAMKPIEINKCSYMILNHYDNNGDNLNQCNIVKNGLEKEETGIDVTKVKIINATKQNEVDELLEDALNTLSTNLSDIDKTLQDDLKNKISEFIANMNIWELGIDEIGEIIDEVELDNKIDKKLEKLESKLRKLQKSNSNDSEIKDAYVENINEIFEEENSKKSLYKKELKTVLDKSETKILSAVSDYLGDTAVNILVSVSDKLDESLDKFMNETREIIKSVFIELGFDKFNIKKDEDLSDLVNIMGSYQKNIIKELASIQQFKLTFKPILIGVISNEFRNIINNSKIEEIVKSNTKDDVKINALVEGIIDDFLTELRKKLLSFQEDSFNATYGILYKFSVVMATNQSEMKYLFKKYKNRFFPELIKETEKQLKKQELLKKIEENLKDLK